MISGVIAHESGYDFMEDKIRGYKELNFSGYYRDAEIHLREIWQGKNKFEGIDFNTKCRLLNNLYSLIEALPISLIAVAINKHLIISEYPNWSVFNAAWVFLTERFDNYISDNGDLLNKGMMFVDRNSKMPDKEISRIVNSLRKNGSHIQNIKFIHEDPLFVTSIDTALLQIADAIFYCTLKQLYMTRWFNPFWLSIKNKFRDNGFGNILGYGLKIFPRKGNEAI